MFENYDFDHSMKFKNTMKIIFLLFARNIEFLKRLF